jgi:rhodanese-related sulfurtransferase
MEPVTSKLRRTRLFANIPESGLVDLVTEPGPIVGQPDDRVAARPGDLVVILEGGLMMASHDGGAHLAAFSVEEGAREPAVLYTIPPGAELKLTRPSIYLVIDGRRLDSLLSGAHETESLALLEDRVRDRIGAIIKAGPFKQLSFEHLVRCAEAMEEFQADDGEDVITEGAPGDYFYVIESGGAEVWRRDPSGGGAPAVVARLGPGATFGEEALIHGEPRNATVRMTGEGRLLRLSKSNFERLLKSQLLNEVAPEDAARRLARGGVEAIDCRREEEWELWRLPKARLMPLESIRERARGLDQKREYIVYCRTGRRSGAAAFLMRQMGLKAHSLKGGISEWPFELEGLSLGG